MCSLWNDWALPFLGPFATAVTTVGLATPLWNWLFQRKLERLKSDLSRRTKQQEAAASVVGLIELWMGTPDPKDEDKCKRWKLQKAYWEFAIWVDKEMLDSLKILHGGRTDGSANNIANIIIEARNSVRGASPDLKPAEVLLWYDQ